MLIFFLLINCHRSIYVQGREALRRYRRSVLLYLLRSIE